MLVISQRSKYYPIDGSSGQQLSPINEKVRTCYTYICALLMYRYIEFHHYRHCGDTC